MKKILLLFIISVLSVAFAENTNILKSDYEKDADLIIENSDNWEPYMQYVEHKIKSSWTSPVEKVSKQIVTKITIAKNGELLDIKIIKSSDNKHVDESAISAIRKSAPFKPLPKKYKGDSIPIEFTFDYKTMNDTTVYNSSDNQLYSSENKKLSLKNNRDIYIEQVNYDKSQQEKTNSTINWHPYMQKLDKTIKRNWKSPAITESRSVTVQFKVNKNGEFSDINILKSSNDKQFDESAIAAVRNSSPYEPLPDQFKGVAVPVEITFGAYINGNNSIIPVRGAGGISSPYNDHVIKTYNMLSH